MKTLKQQHQNAKSPSAVLERSLTAPLWSWLQIQQPCALRQLEKWEKGWCISGQLFVLSLVFPKAIAIVYRHTMNASGKSKWKWSTTKIHPDSEIILWTLSEGHGEQLGERRVKGKKGTDRFLQKPDFFDSSPPIPYSHHDSPSNTSLGFYGAFMLFSLLPVCSLLFAFIDLGSESSSYLSCIWKPPPSCSVVTGTVALLIHVTNVVPAVSSLPSLTVPKALVNIIWTTHKSVA